MRGKVFLAVAVAAALGIAGAPASGGTAVDKSDNVKLVKQFPFEGGTELAAEGKYLYAGQLNGDAAYPSRNRKPEQGGVHIFDVSRKKPKKVGFLHCPGNDNDVEVVEPGFIAVGHHTNICNPQKEGTSAHGLFIADVRNPKRPTVVGRVLLPTGSSSHTIKPYPGKPYVYVNPGGLPQNGGATTRIVDVSDVTNPKVVATFQPNRSGCHDFSFFVSKEKKLGFCTGYQESQIWDVSDPVKPTVVGRIVNPAIQFMHYAVANSDGTLLAIDDEAFAAHECHTGNSPTGRVWIYDISNPASPQMVSSFAPPRGGDATGVGTFPGWIRSWCLSHGLDWQAGTNNLAVTWFTGGMSVLNLGDATTPKEIAYFQAEDSTTYSALWHRGRLYTNDSTRGVDAFKLSSRRRK